jgi:hypothetical protein
MPGPFNSALIAGVIAISTVGCSSTAAAGGGDLRSVTVQQPFPMLPGESVALPDRSVLRYVGVKSDSRCRPDVKCVWAGDAEVSFEWTASGAATESFGLHTGFADKSSRALPGHTLKLLQLARGANPEAQLQLDPAP